MISLSITKTALAFSTTEVSILKILGIASSFLIDLSYGLHWPIYPAGIYLFKVNNRNTRTRCEICS